MQRPASSVDLGRCRLIADIRNNLPFSGNSRLRWIRGIAPGRLGAFDRRDPPRQDDPDGCSPSSCRSGQHASCPTHEARAFSTGGVCATGGAGSTRKQRFRSSNRQDGPPMTVEVSQLQTGRAKPGVDDVLVVRVAGEVDLRTAPQLQVALDETVERMTGGRVVIDLTDVAFFGSPGLAVLAEAAAQADQHRCALRVVVGINPLVRRSIEVTGLDRVLTLCVNVVEAATL